jgi:hypothetical protein
MLYLSMGNRLVSASDYYQYLNNLLLQYFNRADSYSEEEQKDLGINYTSNISGVSALIENAAKDKMKIDGYIGDDNEITLNGVLFHKNGGYIQQEKDKKTNLHLKEATLAKAASDSERLATGTRYLWIATGCLVLIEVIKFLYENHFLCGC